MFLCRGAKAAQIPGIDARDARPNPCKNRVVNYAYSDINVFNDLKNDMLRASDENYRKEMRAIEIQDYNFAKIAEEFFAPSVNQKNFLRARCSESTCSTVSKGYSVACVSEVKRNRFSNFRFTGPLA